MDSICISRREFITQAAATAAVMLCNNDVLMATEPNIAPQLKIDRPNIIVVLADDLGWGDLSCYPQDSRYTDARIRTPNLDNLAAEGVRCTQAYATCMICAPSRAGLLSGRYQEKFGWYEFKETLVGMPKDEMMLQEFLKRHDYSTACIGKWHLGHKTSVGPLTRGFDRFYGFLGGQHDYFDPRLGDPIHAFSFDYDAPVMDQNTSVGQMEYLTDELTNRSIKYIEEQTKANRPFFLYLPYNAPHPPMQSKWEDLKPYADARDGQFNVRDLARAMVNSMDHGVGKILDKLLQLGIDRNTLMIFTSDNGGTDDGNGRVNYLVTHNGGLRARKGFYWEGGIRVPFIIRWPSHIPKGLVYDKPVSHLDIFATCAAAVGDPSPKLLDGVDLVPFLNGLKKQTPHDILYWGLDENVNKWAVRKGDWKLTSDYLNPQTIYDGTLKIVMELHNIETDPFERDNLVEQRPELVAELLKLKQEFYKQCPTSIATPEVLNAWKKDIEVRKKKRPAPEKLNRPGAPGHWLR